MSIISGGNEPNKIRVGTQEVKAVYAGTNLVWRPKFTASGGAITDSGGYRYHTFNSSGTFVVTAGEKQIEYLIVGGGGGGSFGGGGAGAVVQGSTSVSSSLSITVGKAGVKGDPQGNKDNYIDNRGSNGGDSSITGVASASGGGGGGGGGSGHNTRPSAGTYKNGRNGACGGGGAAWWGDGTAGQGSVGFNGGAGNDTGGSPYPSAGGGGMGGAGQTPPNGSSGGIGGSPITVWGKAYAGGGGGGNSGQSGAGSGGGAGAGNAGSNGQTNGQDAQPNTGSGGGGNGGNAAATQGGNGGSGVVVIRYATPVRSAVKEALKRKASQNENAEEEGHKA